MDETRELQQKLRPAPGGGAVQGAAAYDAGTPLPSDWHLVAEAGGFRLSCSPQLPADSARLIDQLAGLEDLKAVIAARQARITVAFEQAHRQDHAGRGEADGAAAVGGLPAGSPLKERGQDAAAQIALARRESPNRGGRLLGFSKALVTEMPHTLAALDTGQLNEWRATLIVRETACLDAADRCAVDEELAADTGTFIGAGDRTVAAAARTAAYRRDPRSITQRASNAATDRHVSIRPAPDTMTYLMALLPVKQGVAVYAALSRRADTLCSDGDGRSRGQIMADALVERTTGTPEGITGVEIQLVMTDRTLFQGDSEPARLAGYGIVPAGWARALVAAGSGGQSDGTSAGLANRRLKGQSVKGQGLDVRGLKGRGLERLPSADGLSGHDNGKDLNVWLRRLYTAPGTGDLVGMDSRARLFTPGLRRLIEARDDTCRTPYCDAPIRHHDHVVPWHQGGSTNLVNSAGLCEACNHTKELSGWKAQPRPGPRHAIEVRTPTGHSYRSMAPPLPGTRLLGAG